MKRASLLIVVLLAALSTPAHASGGDLTIHVRVALVVFDSSGMLDAGTILGLAGDLEFTLERKGAVADLVVDYVVEADAYQAPPGETARLTAGLEALYEYPAPRGPRGPSGAARLPLEEAYWTIYQEARRVIGSGGGDPDSYDDIVVIIGDLDGVARYYYIAKPYAYVPHGYLAFDSVRGWGGYAPMTFYDLAAVQAKWPYYKVPYYNAAPPASPDTEPVVWGLEDPDAYAARLFRDHLEYHVIGDSVYTPLTLSLTVHVIVVDFGNETVTREVERMIGAPEAERLAEALAPWINIDIDVENARAPPELVELYQSSPRDGEYRVLEYEQLHPILEEIASQYPQFNASTPWGEWTFIVLATPEPAYLTYHGTLNFTGYSTQSHGATTIPGLDERIYRGGLPAVIAHEIGHLLGEGHPFQVGNRVRWLMDMQATVMSYFDDGIPALGDYYHYSAMRISVLQAIQYAHLALARGGNTTLAQQALQAAEAYDGTRALTLALAANGINWPIPRLPPPTLQGQTHQWAPHTAPAIIVALAILACIALQAAGLTPRRLV